MVRTVRIYADGFNGYVWWVFVHTGDNTEFVKERSNVTEDSPKDAVYWYIGDMKHIIDKHTPHYKGFENPLNHKALLEILEYRKHLDDI